MFPTVNYVSTASVQGIKARYVWPSPSPRRIVDIGHSHTFRSCKAIVAVQGSGHIKNKVAEVFHQQQGFLREIRFMGNDWMKWLVVGWGRVASSTDDHLMC